MARINAQQDNITAITKNSIQVDPHPAEDEYKNSRAKKCYLYGTGNSFVYRIKNIWIGHVSRN